MNIRTVKRYYCDFCKKANMSAGSIRNHEKHCTNNPARECGVCKMVAPGYESDFVQVPLADMVAMLPDPKAHARIIDGTNVIIFDYSLTEVANAALPALRNAAGNCPACIMAAIRQRGIPVPMVTDFNWTNEMKAIWNEINAGKEMERDRYGY